MILPAKHLSPDGSIIGIGAEILQVVSMPKTVSETWTLVRDSRVQIGNPITFDWFVLAVSWLYAISAVELIDGHLQRKQK